MELEILYNGKQIAVFEPGQKLTLKCNEKTMLSDLIIREKSVFGKLSTPSISKIGHYIEITDYDSRSEKIVVMVDDAEKLEVTKFDEPIDLWDLELNEENANYISVKSRANYFEESDKSSSVTYLAFNISVRLDGRNIVTVRNGTLWSELIEGYPVLGFTNLTKYVVAPSGIPYFVASNKTGEFVTIYTPIDFEDNVFVSKDATAATLLINEESVSEI